MDYECEMLTTPLAYASLQGHCSYQVLESGGHLALYLWIHRNGIRDNSNCHELGWC